jgi:hypothetical protein
MSRKNTYIPQYENFFKTLKFTLKEYGDKFNVSPNSYFADKLGFKSLNAETQFNQLLNTSDKDLTVRELIFMFEILKEDSKPILDYFAKETNLICSITAKPLTHKEELQNCLMKFSIDNGLLNASYLKAIQDNEISSSELQELQELSYQTRSRLNQFEQLLEDLEVKAK